MKFPSLRRNKIEDPTLPKEVQAYYEAEQRDRRGVAGLLAVGTLIVTILVAAGLFFGGRWAYRSIRHTDKKPNVATTGTSSTKTETPNNSADTPVPNDSNNSQNTANSSTSATDSSTSTSSTGAASTSTSASSSAAAATSSNLPTTGSDGSVAAFMGATIGSIVIAELYQRRKLTR